MHKKLRWYWPCLLFVLLCGLAFLFSADTLYPSRGTAVVASTVTVASAAQAYWSQITIDAYNYDQYLFYQHSNAYNMDYPSLDWSHFNRVKSPHTYQTVVMENAFLQLTLIPALGGRVYSLVFKPTGNNEFYSNTVIKPTHWGPPEQGWWLAAGGMEWCLPVDEHGYEWGIPWMATIHDDVDGATVVLTDTARTDRLRARITLHLPDDRSFFTVAPRLENPTGGGIWYKYWTNVQVAPGPLNTLSEDFRFILPIDQVTVHSTGDDRVPGPGGAMSWPVYNGIDWSKLGNWNQWLGFFARPAAAYPFQGVYDTGANEGLVRVYPHLIVRGAKGFAWGWNKPYPDEWTDGARAYYAEIHGGIAPTFWDSTYLGPYSHVEWTETLYPVAHIGGLTTATAEAALSLQVQGSQVTLGAQPTIAQTDGIVALCRPAEATPLHVHRGTLTPALPYQAVLSLSGDLSQLVLAFLDQNGQLLATTARTTDRRPPTTSVQPLPAYVTDPAELTVSWSGSDRETCLLYYDIQVKDGYGGTWTDWLTHTQSTSATFPDGQDGHTYFFRSRACDLYGNVGRYGGAEWGEAFSSVLVTPAPVLETSRKWANVRGAISGDVLTYTLSLRNTGNADAPGVLLTDFLPSEVVLLTGTVKTSDGSPVMCAGNALLWSGTVTAMQQVQVTGAVQVCPTVPIDLRTVLNTMQVTWGSTTLNRQSSFILGYTGFMPLIRKADAP